MADKPGAGARTPRPPKPTAKARRLERELHETRTEIRTLRAKASLRRLRESGALDFDWVGPWMDVLGQRQTEPGRWPLGGTASRRHGHYFPFFQNEQQLTLLRDLSRIVVGTNNHAGGMVNGLTSFVIGTGYKIKVTPAGPDGKASAERLTTFLDEWAAANAWDEFQQEAFWRHREDGDALIRLFPDDGLLKVRHVWPEQLTQPPGTTVAEYGYGVRCHPRDAATPEAYWLADLGGGSAADGEEVAATDLVHLKANSRTGIKRGLPDFSFGTKDCLDAAGRLTRNLGEGAAVREAIAYMRQHAAAGPAEVEEFRTADADFRERRPFSDDHRPVNSWEPGTVVDFPEGMEHAGAPANPGTAAHAAVVQVLLRSAGVKWNAPDWLVSGDASNMGAYTSSLVAESPFVRSVVRAQQYYRARFLLVVRRAVVVAEAHGLLPGGILKHVTLDLIPPSPEVRNKLEEAQRAQVEIPLGVDSRQRYCEAQDRDFERVTDENRQFAEENGQPGQPLPLDAGGGAGARTDTGLPESLLESRREGEVWQGDSGRWFTLKGGHVVPHAGPQDAPGAAPAAPAGKAQPAIIGHPVLKLIAPGLKGSPGLTDPQRKEYTTAISKVLTRMPKVALDRIAEHLAGATFHADTKALGLSVIDTVLAVPELTDAERAHFEAQRPLIESGHIRTGGASVVGPDKRMQLHLDGPFRAPGDMMSGAHGGAEQPTHEVHAHELMHVLDGPDKLVSNSAPWKKAFDAEIGSAVKADDGTPRLTRYAHVSRQEGLAEFGRLVYGGAAPLDLIEREFPLASKLFKDLHLWPS